MHWGEVSSPAQKRVSLDVDGLKFHLQKASIDSIQSHFYNVWTCGYYVSNIFVFVSYGRVVSMVINAPGSLHDSSVSEFGSLYQKLEKVFQSQNVSCVVDSALKNVEYMIKSSQ